MNQKGDYSDQIKYEKCLTDIAALLQRTSQIFQIMEREQRKETGFTGSQSFLLTLLLKEKRLTMGEIGERMHLEKSSVTRLIIPLKSSLLVETQTYGEDKRIQHVSLTDRGRFTAEAVKAGRESYYGKLISLLPRGHVREVMTSTEILFSALERIEESGDK